MALTLKRTNEAPKSFIKDVYEIEKKTYSADLCGTLENQILRYDFENDSFLLVYDGDTLVGYVNFLLLSDTLFEQMKDKNRHEMRDDDIMPSELCHWRKDSLNHLFIISVVVVPKYRGGEAIKLLGNGLLAYIRDKEKDGYPIGSISGSAVSDGGSNFMKRFGAVFHKEVDGGYLYYLSEEKNIRELITNGLLLKNV